MESYDPFTDTWTPIRPALKYVSNFSVAGCGGRLYLVGSSACKYNALALQCYNPVTGMEGDGGVAGAGGGPRGPGVGHRWPQGPSARPRLSGWMGGGTPGIGVANVVRERAATGLLQRAMAPPQRWMGWWRKAGAHRGHQHRAIAPHSLEVWGLEAQCQVEGWGDQEALPQVLNLSGCWIGLEPALWEGAVGLDPRGLVGTSSGSRVGVGVWAPI